MANGSVVEAPVRLGRLPLQAITSGLTIALLHVAAISVLLAAADAFALSARETTMLIVGAHGLTALLSVGMTLLYRMPMLIGLNATSLLFLMPLATSFSYQEMMGGVVAGGVLVVVVAFLGLSARLTALIPVPIVFGTVAGAILPFVIGIFDALAVEPVMIGLAFASFILARRVLPAHIPAVLPALLVGILVAGWDGMLRGARDPFALPMVSTAGPAFSWQAVVAIAPVVAILVSANANVASIIYMRSQGYDPPERGVNIATGLATIAGGCLGVIPISKGTLLMPLVAGPDAGAREHRRWASYASGVGMALIVVFAGVVAQMPRMVPMPLLLSVAGMVLLGVLGQMLVGAIGGGLRVGPLLAFTVAASDLTLWGFGPAIWALVIGTTATLLLEHEALSALRAPAASPAGGPG